MKSIEAQFILRAASPIVQKQKTAGNVGILNRTPVVLNDGSIREIAEVTGNAMRNGLRRAAALLILDSLGLLQGKQFDSPDAVRFLFNGGGGSGSDNTLRIDDVRAMNALIPSTALFGGCTKGMIHFGRLEVAPATLICEETLPDLAPWQRDAVGGITIHPSVVYEYRQDNFQHDETVKPLGRFLLTEAAQRKLDERLRKREGASDTGDVVAAEEAKGGMRPYATQAIKRGSLFTWSVVGHVEDEIQEATFHAILSAFLRRPVVGSGRSVGRGRFEVFAVKDFDHLRPAEVMRERDPSSVTDPGLEKVFTDYILSRGDEVKEWLRSVQA